MKKRNNKIIRLVLIVEICLLFIAVALSTATVKSADVQGIQTKEDTTPILPKNPRPLGLFNFRILNLDWNYWDNKPNLFLIPGGNVGIGTINPIAKLDVFGNIAINGNVVINEVGNWVGNLSGMQGPAGPQGPQGPPGQNGSQGPPGPPGFSLWDLNGNNIYYNNGSVGIGTSSPLSKFQVDDGAVLFNGTTGSTPVSGGGKRLMWIPSKSAFRVGYISGNEWDDVNIGMESVAMGYCTIASGQDSTAIGCGTTASGYYSTAMGIGTIASGWGSTAIGQATTASEDGSTAMGTGTTANGTDSTAMGDWTTACGYDSTAMGMQTTASGGVSTAMGQWTTATGDYSTAMGRTITVNGDNSVGIGLNYQNPNWVVNANNVMSIMGGNVGIGTTSPTTPLDVSGNVKTSGDYKYTSLKTYYLNIPAAAFTSLYASYYNYYNTGAYTYQLSGPSTTLVCPVNLPQGAVVTEFRTYAYDNNATYNVELISSLYTQTLTLGVWDLMAKEWLNTSGSSYNIQPTIDTTIQYATIDNANNQYWIYVNFDANTNNNINLRFYGSRITYTMDTVAP